ncbi:TonB-dependent receptor [Gilvimarinus sp. 2_MG-2023]|uniref:TonB-dependent receptor n=1 Tax=Gilvimarinus sp. 2_MG-2023 TaxID=3062666 RepID=UPI0026E3B5E4|nr:TonB-dependent receptor [Gilvimarinus sp. 2_MG-2023]MDO6569420.1 TonB-dependent receptor [Gilvimarinus sp. 2_MG-2023]
MGTTVNFNISSDKADITLTEFAQQSNLTVIVPYDKVFTIDTPALEGNYSIINAAVTLLEETGLRLAVNQNGQLTIRTNNDIKRIDSMLQKNKLSSAVIMALSTLASAQNIAQETELAYEENKDEMVIEEVISIGIRGSLSAAIDVKRDSDQIVDAIVAEDIGKLPDNNIAEALQRVTGVSINRDFGVGSEVSIRGLPQNRVELNGRSTLGDGRNGVNFQDFPASFLSRVEVVKSPTPEMIEGALGGTVNLKTIRPVDLTEPVAAISIDAEYADKTDNWAPILSASVGNNWDLGDAGTFGAMAMLSYQDRELRRDRYEVNLFVYDDIDMNLDGEVDATDSAQNTPSGQYVVPMGHKYEPYIEERERTAFNVSLQWEPASGQGNFYLDLNGTERDGNQEAYSILPSEGNPVATSSSFEDDKGMLNNYRIEGVALIPKTWSEFRQTDTTSSALGGEWHFTDNIKVSGEYSYAESNTYQPRSEFNLRGVDPVAEAENPQDTNDFITSYSVINANDSMPSVIFDGGNHINNNSLLALREYRTRDLSIDNEEEAFRLDAQYSDIGKGDWLTIKAGFRTTERDYTRQEAEVRLTNIYRDMFDSNGDPGIIWVNDIESQFPGSIISPNVSADAFEHTGFAGANDLRDFTVFDAGILKDTEQTFSIVQSLLAGSNYNSPDNGNGYIDASGSRADNLQEVTGSYALINEQTSAAYLQFNLDFENVKMVFGGRQVNTELTSTAYNQDGDALVSETNKYNDFLPSMNMSVYISEDTILRFAGAKVMRRADFDLLSPTYQFNSDRLLATKGNPQLEPFRATQFDISAEHYFGEGDMLSATVFFKNVESFLKSEQFCSYQPEVVQQQNLTVPLNVCIRPTAVGDSSTYLFTDDPAELASYVEQGRNGILTTVSTNGSSGTIEGVELGYQQSFDSLPGVWSGLGLIANYTFSKSEDPDGVPLEDISENSANLQVYWENETFGVRLAYSYRDKFLDNNLHKRVSRLGDQVAFGTGAEDPTEGNDYRDGLEQIDLSASWNVNDALTLVANVNNLTGEANFNQGATGTTWQIQESGRRMSLGARYSF